MRHAFIAFMLMLLSVLASGQTVQTSAKRFYRVNDYLIVANATGGSPETYAYTEVSIQPYKSSTLIRVVIGNVSDYYPPDKFLNQSGSPYGNTVDAAITAFANAGPSVGGGSVTGVASATANGLLSSADWSAFNSKQNALGYVPLNPSNNLSDVLNLTQARTNLGLGSLATQSGTFSGSSSGTNTGDETGATIRTKLGITTLSGSNTGDQDISGISANTTAIASHTANQSNPHGTTADQVGAYTTTQTDGLLAGKANTSHTHTLSNLTQSGATTGQVPSWNGTGWVPINVSSSGTTSYTALTNQPSLGTLSSQNSNNVSITGGAISGLSSLGITQTGSQGFVLNAASNYPWIETRLAGTPQLYFAQVPSASAFFTNTVQGDYVFRGDGSTGALSFGVGNGTGNATLNVLPNALLVGTRTNNGTDMVQVSQTSSLNSGTDAILNLSKTVTHTGTAGYTGIRLNTTENSVGSGSNLLMDLQRGGTSQFSVRRDGLMTIASTGSGAATMSGAVLTMGGGNLNVTTSVAGAVTMSSYNSQPFTFSANGHNFSSNYLNTGLIGSSGTATFASFTTPINQSGTAGYTGIRLNITETAVGSGAKNLMSLGVGGTALMRVTNTGDTYVTTSTAGFILRSPDGTCYRITVANGGTLTTTSITCP